MRADDFLDGADSADAFLDGGALPAAPKKAAPSLTDQIYGTVNKLFRDKSVMDGVEETGKPFDPVATAKLDRFIEQPRATALPAAKPEVGVVEKGVRGGVAQLAKSGLGATQMLSEIHPTAKIVAKLFKDATGADVADIAAGAAQRADQSASNPLSKTRIEGFAPNSIVQDLPAAGAGAISSVIGNLPALAANVVMPGVGLPLMGAQVASSEYSDGRAQGLDPAGALLRSLPMAAAEVAGEKLGGFNQVTQGIRRTIDEGSVVPLARAMVASSAREIPSEMATTAMQFGVDKLPGVGLQQEATAADLGAQLKDTALQTALQAGGMGSIGTALQGSQTQPQAAPPVTDSAPVNVQDLTNLIAGTAKIDSRNAPSADDFLDAVETAAKNTPAPSTEGDQISQAEKGPAHVPPDANQPDAPRVPVDATGAEPAVSDAVRAADPVEQAETGNPVLEQNQQVTQPVAEQPQQAAVGTKQAAEMQTMPAAVAPESIPANRSGETPVNSGETLENPITLQNQAVSHSGETPAKAELPAPARIDADRAPQIAEGQTESVERAGSWSRDSSWVIRNKETGEVIMETFDRKKVKALNTAKYEAVPIGKHLAELNQSIKQDAQPAAQQPVAELETAPPIVRDAIKGQLDDYQTITDTDESDVRASMERPAEEPAAVTRAEEGSNRTAAQDDRQAPYPTVRAERARHAAEGTEVRQDPDSDIPFDASDRRMQAPTGTAREAAQARAKSRRLAIQRRYEQNMDKFARDKALAEVSRDLQKDLAGTEQMDDVPFSRSGNDADIPAPYWNRTRVKTDVWVTDQARFEQAEVSAQEAIDSVREDIANYKKLLDCMRG